MKYMDVLVGLMLAASSVSVFSQNYCAANPEEASCCNPDFDTCLPRKVEVRYGHMAGDLCVPGYPTPLSCGGTMPFAANYSTESESLEWRMGFLDAYWNSTLNVRCRPLQFRGPKGSWTGDISQLRLHELQTQSWSIVLTEEGSPYPESGPISCATPRELVNDFYITRYLVEEECGPGFTQANRVPDDIRVCKKKGRWEISISGPSVTPSLPSISGPVLQRISLRRGGRPAARAAVSVSLKNEATSQIQQLFLTTDSLGEARFLFVPPYFSSTTVRIWAECANCDVPAEKFIHVVASQVEPGRVEAAACMRKDFN
jgi:hypothetical protein